MSENCAQLVTEHDTGIKTYQRKVGVVTIAFNRKTRRAKAKQDRMIHRSQTVSGDEQGL